MDESCIDVAVEADKNVSYWSLAIKYKFAKMEDSEIEVEGVEESNSGIFAVYSIVIEEVKWSNEMRNAHWFVSEIWSSSHENPLELPFDVD